MINIQHSLRMKGQNAADFRNKLSPVSGGKGFERVEGMSSDMTDMSSVTGLSIGKTMEF